MSKIIISILVVIFSVLLPGNVNNVEVNISEPITQESTYIEYSVKNNTGRIINPLITFKSLEKKSGNIWVDATADWDDEFVWTDRLDAEEYNYHNYLMPGSIFYNRVSVKPLSSGEYRLTIRYSVKMSLKETVEATSSYTFIVK